MLVLMMWRAQADLDLSVGLAKLGEAVPRQLRPVLGPALLLQKDILGLEPSPPEDALDRSGDWRFMEPIDRLRGAEIFTDATALFLVIGREEEPVARRVRTPEGNYSFEVEEGPQSIELTMISPTVESPNLAPLKTCIGESFGVELTPHYYVSERFRELQEEGREHPDRPAESEAMAAHVLTDRAIRTLAQAIKASGGLLVKDVARQLGEEDRPRAADLQQALTAAGIVTAESVVTCKKTSAQVARLQPGTDIAQLGALGLRCACGRELDQERAEEAMALSDLGKTLLDGSRWMTILLIEELEAVGVPLEGIFVEQQSGGDEMDCLADISGELVLFELKDKDFSLGNAYSFGAKMGVVRPGHSIIITTGCVGNDAKDHFQRAGLGSRGRRRPPRGAVLDDEDSSALRYIEGIADLRTELRSLASAIYAADAEGLVGEALNYSSLAPSTIINRFHQEVAPASVDSGGEKPAPRKRRPATKK